jgi:hypothetical protein
VARSSGERARASSRPIGRVSQSVHVGKASIAGVSLRGWGGSFILLFHALLALTFVSPSGIAGACLSDLALAALGGREVVDGWATVLRGDIRVA